MTTERLIREIIQEINKMTEPNILDLLWRLFAEVFAKIFDILWNSVHLIVSIILLIIVIIYFVCYFKERHKRKDLENIDPDKKV